MIEFGGVITEAPEPGNSDLLNPTSVGERFSGQISFDDADVEQVVTEDRSFYVIPHDAQLELSFGGFVE